MNIIALVLSILEYLVMFLCFPRNKFVSVLMVFNISLFIGSDNFGIMQYNNYMYGLQVIMSADAITIGN